MLKELGKYRNTALLIMRLGLGIMMVFHGYPKIAGGSEKWAALGGSMEYFGITAFPVFWGFAAALAEAIGGLLLIIGFLFRPACLLLALTMIVATVSHFGRGQGLMEASHAIETGISFIGLFFLGPGKYSVDRD